LFTKADTDEFSFIIHKNIQHNIDNLEIFYFIGKIIGKSLIENITINTCFNKIFYKLILNEDITIQDLQFFDKSLYLSLIELQRRQGIEEFGMYFVVNYEIDGEIYSDDLIPDGSNIIVNNNNLDLYINKRIEYIIKTA